MESPSAATESSKKDLGGDILDRDLSVIRQLLDECPLFVRKDDAEYPVGNVRVEVDDGRHARLGDLEPVGELGEWGAVTPETAYLGGVLAGELCGEGVGSGGHVQKLEKRPSGVASVDLAG